MFEDIEVKAYSTMQETQLKYWEKIRHPFVAGLELTSVCNMRCVHCYMSDAEKKIGLSTEEWKRVIDRLYEAGVLILYMTGGEIFTRKDFLEIYLYAKKKGFIIELLTNATLLNEEIIEAFKIYPPATVSISVYGMTAQTYESVTTISGSFQKFYENVKKLYEADIDIELKFIGLKTNVQDFALAEAFAQELGVKFKYNFEIFPTLQGGKEGLNYRLSNEDIVDFEINYPNAAKVIAANVLKKNPFLKAEQIPVFTCNVASTLCYIDSNGFVSPCNKMRLKKYNVLEVPLATIWEDYIKEYANMLAPKSYKCAKCSYIHICSPCPVINKLSTGDYVIPCAEYCELTMLRAKEFSKEKYNIYRTTK